MTLTQLFGSKSCSWYENPSVVTPCRFDSGPGHHFLNYLFIRTSIVGQFHSFPVEYSADFLKMA